MSRRHSRRCATLAAAPLGRRRRAALAGAPLGRCRRAGVPTTGSDEAPALRRMWVLWGCLVDTLLCPVPSVGPPSAERRGPHQDRVISPRRGSSSSRRRGAQPMARETAQPRTACSSHRGRRRRGPSGGWRTFSGPGGQTPYAASGRTGSEDTTRISYVDPLGLEGGVGA